MIESAHQGFGCSFPPGSLMQRDRSAPVADHRITRTKLLAVTFRPIPSRISTEMG